MTDIDAIRERHVKTDDDGGPDYCLMDGLPWPCDTATVLAALGYWEATAAEHADMLLAAEARVRRLRQRLHDAVENAILSGDSPHKGIDTALATEAES